jgi:peptide/nickel transport system substrate-binding protein
MMAVFNNLVLYDQHVAHNSLDTIVPDLAESWSWSEEGTRLTLKLKTPITGPWPAAVVYSWIDTLAGLSKK